VNLKVRTVLFVLLCVGMSDLAAAPPDTKAAPAEMKAASAAEAEAKAAAKLQVAPGVRMKLEEFVKGPEGAKRLASLKKAIARMKSLDSSTNPQDFRRSWAYWANIHGYYGQSSPDGTVAQQIDYLKQNGMAAYVKYYQGIVDQTPPDQVATTTWATCEHSGGVQSQQAQNFFTWHRMYLYYFEKVLQWAADDATLRLPYWNYTDPAQEQLPAEFRVASSVFYDDKRNPDINSGTQQLNPNSTNIDTALKISNYLDYEFKIERGIHGYVHCTVGPRCPVAHMGDVPVAGNDPIFYTHHANIDRMFSCWEAKYGIPSGSWSTQKYSFPDQNGNMVTGPVSDFLDTTKLGYVYDNSTACTRTRLLAQAVSAEVVKPVSLAKVSTAVEIKKPKVSVDVPLTPEAHNVLRGIRATAAQPIYLVLAGITAKQPPGAVLDIYIHKKDNPAARQFVGTISWFNDFGVGHHHKDTLNKTEEFDISEQLTKLGLANEKSVSVSIEASSGTVPAGKVGALAATPTELNAEAGVSISSIEIRQGK